MKTRIGLPSIVAALACAAVLSGQTPAEPRRINYLSNRSVVEAIEPGDRHLIIRHPRVETEPPPLDPGTSYLTGLVEFNSIILTGLVIRKQPAFLELLGRLTVVPMREANWIGSHLTVAVERVFQTPDELPLMESDLLSFLWEYDGTATINGTRVDTETPWLWPIEEGGRYLIAGIFTEVGRTADKTFMPTTMWLEPSDGAPLRGAGRRNIATLNQPVYETVPTFDRDGPEFHNASLYEIVHRLEQEVTRQRSDSPR